VRLDLNSASGFSTPTLRTNLNEQPIIIQDLSELADQNNTVTSSSSGNNRKNIFLNPSSLDFKIRTFLIHQSRRDIKLP
jgi:hypothetical protein